MRRGTQGVLVTSRSNAAVDAMVDALSRAGVAVVRLGRPEPSRPELLPYCLDFFSGAAIIPVRGECVLWLE